MKKELTTKMHSEFTVSEETEIQLRVWSAIKNAKARNVPIESVFKLFNISIEDYEKYKNTVPK